MNCRAFTERLDEYLEGTLPSRERGTAAAHLRDCGACQRHIARAQALRAALRDLPAPSARPGFFEEALVRAQGTRAARRLPWSYMTGAAIAASLALWIGAGRLPDMLHTPATKSIGVTIALHQTHTVQLAFNAEHELHQATLSLTLPEGVELQGFPGQREVRWQTDLARGANVLSLPLIAVSPAGGALLARLEHGERSTELAVPLYVNDAARDSALPQKMGAVHRENVALMEITNADA